MNNDHKFYVSQKAIIEKDGKVLVLFDPIEGLDFPGGKVQASESVQASLEREVREETGLEIVVGKPFFAKIAEFNVTHELAGSGVYVAAFQCSYVSGTLLLSDEHTSYRWVSRDDYTEVDDCSWFFEILKAYFDA